MSHPYVDEIVPVLERTPGALDALLRGLPPVWTDATDGPKTWSAFDVLGHLVHSEVVNWMPRLRQIVFEGPERPFEPFDREAMFRDSVGKTMEMLLDEFALLRRANLVALREMDLTDAQLQRTGLHPALGIVTARQMLATTVTHDMVHVLQISRTMARRSRDDVGPWVEFLSVMKK